MSDTALLDNPTETTPDDAPAALLNDGFTEPPKEWDFLNSDPIPEEDYHPGESLDDYTDRKEREAAEAEEAAKKAAEATADAPAGEKKADDTPPPKPEDATPDPTLQQKAEMWDRFDEAFVKDPAVIARVAMKGMNADQQAAFLKEVLGTAADTSANLPDIDTDTYEPQSDLEEALLAHWGNIKGIADLKKEVADLRQTGVSAVQEQVRALHDPISTAVYYAELGNAKFEALCEAIGLELPDPDLAAVREKLKDGRTTIKSAVRALVGDAYKTKVAEHKQSKATRPGTPGNSSTRQPTVKAGASMFEIAKSMGQL